MSATTETAILPQIEGEFAHSHALVIGISAYTNDITPLHSAAADASRLAKILEQKHGYSVTLLTDAQANKAGLKQALAALATQVGSQDRLLVYYAGHGQTDQSQDGDEALNLIPQDADRRNTESWLPYSEVIETLDQLNCRHFLFILDCCFAGSVRGTNMGKAKQRDLMVMPKKLYFERYTRFIKDPAWQVLTSSAGDQTSSDAPFDELAGNPEHSPFAEALFTALEGNFAGLVRNDGVITATDLYSYLRDQVETSSLAGNRRQTPQIWPLAKQDKGEYVFLAPGRSPYDLPHNPQLTPENNPYLGLRAFTENEHTLFFGRSFETNRLMFTVNSAPLTIVSGPSGSGKTSLVLAGLLPQLRADTETPRTILAPITLGENPFDQIAALDLPEAAPDGLLSRVAARWSRDRGQLSAHIDAWASANPGKQLVLVLDQFEALCANNQPGSQAGDAVTDLADALSKHSDVVRIVGIIRSDALELFTKVHLTNDSPLTAHWKPENIVPVSGTVSTDRLREMIVGPASERVLFFENDALVNQIANSVAGNPGTLPVLSLVLSATYLNYIKRAPIDRTIIASDYYVETDSPLNGTERALLAHANNIYNQLRTAVDDQIGNQRAEQLLLRMVNIDTDPPSLRQVYYSYQPSPKTYFSNDKELDYAGDVYEAMRALLERLISERLVVGGGDSKGAYVVPAHVALVQKWDQMTGWLRSAHDDLALQRRLFPSAAQWKSQASAAKNRRQRWRATGQLWLEDNSDFERASVTRRAKNSWMNQLEREFIDSSQGEQARRKRWRRISLISTIAVLSVLLVAAVALIIYSNGLEQSSRVQRLMFASNNPPAGASADAPFLLAAEAVVRGASSGVSETLQLEAQQNLRNLLARPDVVAPISTTLDVEEAVFSPSTNVVLLRGASTARLWSLDTGTITMLANQVNTAHFSPDGNSILTVENDNTAHLRDLNGTELAHFAAGHEINTAIVLADNQTVLSADLGNMMQQWSIDGQPQGEATPLNETDYPGAPRIDDLIGSPTQAQAVLLMTDGPAWLWTANANAVQLGEENEANLTAENAAFSPDGKILAVGFNNGRIELWDTAQPEKTPTVLAGHFSWINNLEFSPDGTKLISASADRTARIWSVDGTPIASLNDHTDAVLNAHFSKDGSTIITASTDDTARLWSLDGYQQLVFRHTAPVDEAWCSPDGKYVFSVLTDGRAQLWQAHPHIPGLVRTDEAAIDSLVLASDGKEFLTSSDNIATLWSLSGGQNASFSLDTSILSAETSRDGERVLVVTDEGPELLDRTGTKLATLVDGNESMRNAHFSPDGQAIVTAEGYEARIWDRDGKLLSSLVGHEFWVNTAEFSPDGQHIVTASDDHTAKVWDRSGKLLATLQGHSGAVQRAIFSPNGQHIATLSYDNTVRLWDLAGHELHSLPQGSLPWLATFSPDGKWLAVSNEGNTVQLWNLDAPETPIALKGHTLPVTVVRFSPDSQSVLTGSDDRTVRLWNLQGSETMLLRGASDTVTGAVFVPGGENNAAASIITSSFDGAIRTYPLDREALLSQAACRVNSQINPAVLKSLINDISNNNPEFDYSTYSCPLALGQ